MCSWGDGYAEPSGWGEAWSGVWSWRTKAGQLAFVSPLSCLCVGGLPSAFLLLGFHLQPPTHLSGCTWLPASASFSPHSCGLLCEETPLFPRSQEAGEIEQQPPRILELISRVLHISCPRMSGQLPNATGSHLNNCSNGQCLEHLVDIRPFAGHKHKQMDQSKLSEGRSERGQEE